MPLEKCCGYRLCGKTFLDASLKHSQKFCCPEHGRREKAFRTGKAKDESYFRAEKTTGWRICHQCRLKFLRGPGSKTIRCPSCLSSNRDKSCRACEGSYRDESLKNTQRYCPACQSKTPQRPTVSNRTQSARRSQVRSGQGRLDYLSTMTRFTQTWWGRVGELLFLTLYPDASDAICEYGNRSPFDAQHRTLGRVSVKTTHTKQSKRQKALWNFQLGDSSHSDSTFLVGFSEDFLHVERAWLFPSKDLPRSTRVLCPGSSEYKAQGEIPAEQVAVLERQLQVILSAPEVPSGEAEARVEYDRITLGNIGEAIYQILYPTSLHVAKTDPLFPWDFTDSDGSRVNVRVRRKGPRDRWTFFRSQSKETDAYFFIGLGDDSRAVEVALRVPASEMPPHGFSFREGGSKWSLFKVGIGDRRMVSEFVQLPDLEATHIQITSLTPATKNNLSQEGAVGLLHRAFEYHRTLGFPFPAPPSDKRLASWVDGVRRYSAQGKDLPVNNDVLGLCSAFMPHRFSARNADADFSALTAFHDDVRLNRALEFCLGSGRLTRPALRSALTSLNRTPTQFRPAVAKALVDSYAPSGGVVFDPCAGWGGRLAGTLIAGRKYLGVEPLKLTADALWKLGMRLCEHLHLDRDYVRILESPIQAVPTTFFADFALTSPPYWTKEIYDGQRSSITVDSWVTDFLQPMFLKVGAILRPGAAFAVNVVDVKDGRKLIPLEQLAVETAESTGFRLEGSWRMLKGSFGSQTAGRFEPVFVFRKAKSV